MHRLTRRWSAALWLGVLGTLLPIVVPGASAQDTAAGVEPGAAEGCGAGLVPADLAGTPACVEDVTFPSGTLSLAGQWFRPPGDRTVPAVVILRGSGESVRGNPWTASLAAVLVREGVGVLVPDKRGSGRSEGDWRGADFSELADDALAGVRSLGLRPDVAADRIGVMGLSQGGQIAPVAAAGSTSVSFVINVVGGGVPFVENVRFEMLHTFREEGLSGPRFETAMGMVDTAIGYVSGSRTWDAYAEALRETRDVLGDRLTDEYFIGTPEHWRWDFFRRMADFDPAEWWGRVEQPALVLLGGADRNTPTAETARRVREAFARSGNPDATVLVFEELGHALWKETGPMSGHGLHPDVDQALGSWVRRVVSRAP